MPQKKASPTRFVLSLMNQDNHKELSREDIQQTLRESNFPELAESSLVEVMYQKLTRGTTEPIKGTESSYPRSPSDQEEQVRELLQECMPDGGSEEATEAILALLEQAETAARVDAYEDAKQTAYSRYCLHCVAMQEGLNNRLKELKGVSNE